MTLISKTASEIWTNGFHPKDVQVGLGGAGIAIGFLFSVTHQIGIDIQIYGKFKEMSDTYESAKLAKNFHLGMQISSTVMAAAFTAANFFGWKKLGLVMIGSYVSNLVCLSMLYRKNKKDEIMLQYRLQWSAKEGLYASAAMALIPAYLFGMTVWRQS